MKWIIEFQLIKGGKSAFLFLAILPFGTTLKPCSSTIIYAARAAVQQWFPQFFIKKNWKINATTYKLTINYF